MPTLEICVDSLESAINAKEGGADRIELCSSLCLGGLTPTTGLLRSVKKHLEIPVFCMLRPRHGNFLYSSTEMEVIIEELLALKDAGADGFVFGALNEQGEVDEEKCKAVIEHASPLSVTFHRAFDCSPSAKWKGNLNEIIRLGFSRLLTSGLVPTAKDGMSMLRRVIEEAAGRIIIMIGSGVDETNLADFVVTFGRESVEYHGSASAPIADPLADWNSIFSSPYLMRMTMSEKVAKMRSLLMNQR